MKTDSGNKIRLGIFVSVAVALFIIVIYVIGNKQHMFSKTFHINGIFKDVGGLQAGNNVRFSGINIGTIEKVMIITDSTVKVDMVIEKHVQQFIKQDASAIIGTEGLMGNKVINIIPGSPTAEIIKDGDNVKSITPVSIDDIMANLKVTTDNASHITDDIASLTAGIRSGRGAIGKLFVDSNFANTLNATLVNAKNAAGGFSENMEAAKHNFLLRGYYKKKEKEAEKANKDSVKNKEQTPKVK